MPTKTWKRHWFGDFETLPLSYTTSADYQQRKDLVYAWMISDDIGKYRYSGINSQSFIDTMINLPFNPKVVSTEIYFHNGSGFDTHFIIPALTQNGFKQRQFVDDKKVLKILQTSDYKEKNKMIKQLKWEPYQFSLLVNKQKKVYQVQISIPGGLNKKGQETCHYIYFKCSYLMFSRSLRWLGDKLVKADIIKESKSKTVFRETPYLNYQEFTKDTQTFEYLARDVEILRIWWSQFSLRINRRQHKLTAGATAYHQWLTVGFNNIKQLYHKMGFVVDWEEQKKTDKFTQYSKGKDKITKTEVAKLMIEKILPHKNLNQCEDLRNWYNGGLVHTHPHKLGLPVKGVYGFDLNSAYPSVMLSKDLPTGEHFDGDGGVDYPYKLYKVIATTILINKYHLNFIIKKNKDGVNFYNDKIPKGHSFYLQTPEWVYFKKCYKGEYQAEIIYSFKTTPGKELFGDYINKWWKIKQAKTDLILTEIAKLMMNCLYGKYGTKNIKESKIYNPEADFDTDRTKWENETTINEYQYFLPIGMAITAYVRMMLVEAVGHNYDKFIYCDTDSLWFQNHQLDSSIVGDGLGQWKVEASNLKGIFAKKKRYLVMNNETPFKIALASYHLPKSLQTIKNIVYGVKGINCGLMNKEVEYGVVLTPNIKDLEPVWYEKFSKPENTPWNNKKEYFNYLRAQNIDLEEWGISNE